MSATGASSNARALHLVGSMPLDTVADVFDACAPLAGHLNGLPDGEVGPRRFWTPYLPLRTFSGHPDLVEVTRPAWADFLQDGRHEQPEDADENEPWLFEIREGVTELDLGSLHYAEPAIASYEEFVARREAGQLPAGLAFQVGIPSTDGVIEDYFHKAEDWAVAKAAYQAAAFAEIGRIADAIPAEDLLIQWDLALEFVSMEMAAASGEPGAFEAAYDRHIATITPLSAGVPASVRLGYHLCYGTWGGWPMTDLRDLSLCVRVANELVATAARPIDYIHMPVIADAGDAFFAPLADLRIGATRLFLGMVHHDDPDDSAIARRIAAARKSAPEFGIGGVCGFGRLNPADMPAVIRSLDAGVRALAAADG